MTRTDLKPGDIVQHPEKGRGLVHRRFARNDVGVVYADKDRDGITSYTCDLDGWERVETIRPGHVQVRVDDLDLGPDMGDSEEDFVAGWQSDFPEYSKADLRLIYRAIAAQRAESTTPADEQDATVADESPAMTGETGDEQTAGTAVTLPCPNCGKAITRTAQVWTGSQRDRTLTWATLGWHTCQPAQPDEPTEFGAKVVVSYPNGTSVRLIRVVDDSTKSGYAWMAESGRVLSWDDLGTYATVSLGWDE